MLISFKICRFNIILVACLLTQAVSQQSNVVTAAVIDFEQSGISELEVQTLTQRFTSELQNTAKAILFDREVLNSQIASAGIYFYQIQTKEFVQTKKMLLLK